MEQQPEAVVLLDQDYLRINFHEVGFSYLLPEILELFQGQVSVYLHKIELFFQQSDLPGLVAEAHALKGTAGSVGATALAMVASHLEQHAASADSIELNNLMVQLRQVAGQTDHAIVIELARLAAEEDAALNLL